MDAADTLKDMIAKDKRPLAALARDAGVPMMGLFMWVKGKQVRYDLRLAEKVYHALTGKRFNLRRRSGVNRDALEPSFLTESFQLDEKSPSGLRWKLREAHLFKNKSLAAMANTKRAGEPAGCIVNRKKGYPRWRIQTTRGGVFAHQVIWVLLNGPIPEGFVIDHADGDSLNNQHSNLRLATRRQNKWNSKTPRSSKSGIKGVTYQKSRWIARISSSTGERIHLGRFKTVEEASEAYKVAAEKYHGEFHNLGKHKSELP